MDAYPLVSVIIPCYNQAHFLPEAIESVLAQTYPHFEIVVINDGSSDNSAEVAARYPSIRYVDQENQGLSAARNTGLRESQGNYLVFLDADDRLLPRALEAGLACLNAHPECAFVSGGYRSIREDGTILPEPRRDRAESHHYAALLRRNYIAMHATVMYRRFFLEAIGGFNTDLKACEDYDVFLRITRDFPIYCYDEVIAEYRQHAANMSRNYELMLKTVFTVLSYQWEYIRDRKQYLEAYQAGRKFWCEFYGQYLVKSVHSRFGARQWKQGLRELLVLSRYDRQGFASLMGELISPMHILRTLQALRQHPSTLSVGHVQMGVLRRVMPVSPQFGYDRGQPIDRYYIENFLASHATKVRGCVLEIGDDSYTRKYGGSRVTGSEVLHIAEGNPKATIIGDLAHADHIPSNTFDCIILTQTLHLIYDVQAAIQTLYRILKPGGVLLATFPGISQISADEWANTWYWSFTTLSARRLFEEIFPPENILVEAHGNVLAAAAFLYGMAAEEFHQEELEHRDPHYEALITLRAVKPGERSGSEGN